MTFVSRKQWGAKPPKDETPTKISLGQARGMAVHYEAVDRAGVKHEHCDDIVRGIQDFHQKARRWNDIAYSFLVCRHGYVYEGRGWGIRTAANGTNDSNAAFHAVCFMDDDQPGTQDATPEALSALALVIRECREKGWGSEVKPHSAFKPTSCPGNELRAWIARRGFDAPCPAPHPSKSEKTPPARPQSAKTPSWYKRVLRIEKDKPFIKGNDVVNVQRRLKARESGLYDYDVASKVRGFQELHGLAVDGVVGPKTAAKLVEVFG